MKKIPAKLNMLAQIQGGISLLAQIRRSKTKKKTRYVEVEEEVVARGPRPDPVRAPRVRIPKFQPIPVFRFTASR